MDRGNRTCIGQSNVCLSAVVVRFVSKVLGVIIGKLSGLVESGRRSLEGIQGPSEGSIGHAKAEVWRR